MARPRSLEAKEKLVAAAIEVLLETGVNGFTVDEVARRSGVAKTTIYRHYDNGQQLMMRALDFSIAPFPTPNTGSLRGDLTEFCLIANEVFCDKRLRRLFLEIVAQAQTDPALAQVKAAMVHERMGPLRTMIELAKARGEVAADLDTVFAADMAEAPFVAHMLHKTEPATEEENARMIDFVAQGLGI